MIGRDLERLLIDNGVSPAKMDAVTRKLRVTGRLPKGGRGANAPQLGSSEAALVVIAVAGSAKANEADIRLEKLSDLTSASWQKIRRSLLNAVDQLLCDPHALANIIELRVGRTTRYAAIHFKDGTVEEFLYNKRNSRSDRFSVEGIVPRALLERIADGLNLKDLVP